jgi:uncharacterized phage-associated protein
MAVRFTFDFNKFLAAVQHIAMQEVPELDKYKVVKLLFLADKYHLVRFSRPITGDRYIAMEYGPVGSQSLELLNALTNVQQDQAQIFGSPSRNVQSMSDALGLDLKFRYPRLLPNLPPAYAHLSKSDLMALDHVIERFGRLGFNELMNLTHGMYAYRKAWQTNPNGAIDFADFFEEDSDAIEGARELMIENAAVAEAFPSIEEL